MGPDDIFPVILTYGWENLHLELADQLLLAGIPPGNCLIVHNPSGHADEWRPTERPGFRSIAMDRNRGYAGGMNRGIAEQRRVGAEVLLLLTHDTRLHADAVPALLDALQRHPDFGVLGLVLDRFADESPPYAVTGRSYGGTSCPNGSVEHLREQPPSVDGIAEVPWTDGSALAIRSVALRDASPLPESYFMYFEEAHLCSVVRTAGWRVGTALGAIAESSPGGTSRPAAYGYLFARNGLDWARRERGAKWALRFGLFQLRLAWRLTPKPGGRRFRDPRTRRVGYALLAGRLWGLVDGLRGRSGPPPRRLAQRGDIAGT